MFGDLMARVRSAMWDADEARRRRVGVGYQVRGSAAVIDVVDNERWFYQELAKLLRAMEDAAVEPGQRLAFADIDTGSGNATVQVEEITVRIELEHIQLLTRDKEPQVYLDSERARAMSCPPEARARLDTVPDQYPSRPGVKFVLLLVHGDVQNPAIVELW
jgi:hypothetical protein